jgi:hypothetical protein
MSAVSFLLGMGTAGRDILLKSKSEVFRDIVEGWGGILFRSLLLYLLPHPRVACASQHFLLSSLLSRDIASHDTSRCPSPFCSLRYLVDKLPRSKPSESQKTWLSNTHPLYHADESSMGHHWQYSYYDM